MTAEDVAILEEKLSDPLWRLTSGELYKIKTADGQGIIPFKPRPEQVELLQDLLAAVNGTGPQKIVKLKSRRLGFSTTIGVFIADCLGFRKGYTATLIDQTQKDDATKKLNGIVKVALDGLKEKWPINYDKSNDSCVVVDCVGTGKSEFFAGTKARGGSNDFLWISEWGAIQFDDPSRSSEIRSGALPSARHGVTVVETTWKGGKGGDLWEICKPSIEGTANDWQVTFVPWWVDPRNVSPDAVHDKESLAYFASIERRLQSDGIVLSDAQRRWYAMERRAQGLFMMRENPTFLDECWRAPIEGAIYAPDIDRARTEGRICSMPVADTLVHTSWDLGAPANTTVWYWQVVGREIRVIDCDLGIDDGTVTKRVARMLSKGYAYGKHFLPHDAKQTERSGRTFAGELTASSLHNVIVLPQTADIWIGINALKGLLSAVAFRTPHCDAGIEALEAYHTKVTSSSGLISNEPVHDYSSHTADALRYMAEAFMGGHVKIAAPVLDLMQDDEDRPRRSRRQASFSFVGR